MNNPYKKFLMNFAQATFVVIVGFIVTAITFKLMAEVSPIEDGLLTTVNLFFDVGVYIICIIYSWRNLNIDIERKEKSFFSYQNEEDDDEEEEEEKKEDEVYTSIPVFPVFAPSPIKHVVGNNKNKTFNVFPTHVCRQEEILRQIEEQNMTAQMMEQMSPPVEEDIAPPPDTEIW